MLEQLLGKKYIQRLEPNGEYKTYQVPVMSVDEIRTMKDNEVLFIHSNKKPIKLKTTSYYQNSTMVTQTKIEPFRMENNMD
jgi:type IV secretory pathway TraG/TraD family ATPase VirD4